MPNHRRAFERFAATIQIPSRDEGLVPFTMWGVQRHFVDEVCRALEQGRHEIIVLKARQIGASTVMLAWDMYWLLRHPGMQGQLSSNTDENAAYFRDVLTEMYKTLPLKFRYTLRQNNRNGMAWDNGSRFLFQTVGSAGQKAGRGRGLNFSHGTEVGTWNSAEAFASLRSAFSERHPAALFIWESTARGFNHWYDLWEDAQKAVTLYPIFLPWWRHEGYALNRAVKQEQQIYAVYWDGRLTSDEHAWQREITRRWRVTLRPEQWAWRRWKVAEKMGDRILADQEFPTLPEHAFQASGQPFIGHGAQARLREQLEAAPAPVCYRYTFGPTIERTRVDPTTEEMAHLTVWEPPDPNAYYVVAADPAYGASALSDRYVCSIWRVSRTRMVQAASFVLVDCTMNQFAWVCCHLAGHYSPSFFILELNGPGMAVHQEIERMTGLGWGTTDRSQIQNFLGNVQSYIWRRPDAMGRGASWQWRTTPRTKVWILNRLRDQIMQDTLVIREEGLVSELGNVRQDGDRFRAEGRYHDDRVIALALAVEMWSSQALPLLEGLPQPVDPLDVADMPSAHQRAVSGFFARMGVAR